MSESGTYIGRFAPSPSGPLHQGSLLAAVASYLDARANGGCWLIRMEDLDPAREPPGIATRILDQLDDFGMQSDKPVLYQSSRLDAYAEGLKRLDEKNLCYPCDCSRQMIRAMGLVYNGQCRHRDKPITGDYAIRVRTGSDEIVFDDLVQGRYSQNMAQDCGDFVILRKDGLFAYQLAVVMDDAYQQITRVVRGIDLLDSTPRQIHLQQLMEYPTPQYAHIPIVVNRLGQKLSKQHYADPVSSSEKNRQLYSVLRILGLNPPPGLAGISVEGQLEWGIAHWDIQKVPKLANIPEQALAT